MSSPTSLTSKPSNSTSKTSNSTSKPSNKRKRVPKCSNCFVENPDHSYKDCKEPCNLCNKSDHKTRSCSYYKIKNRNKRHMPNLNNDDQDVSRLNDSDSGNRELKETEKVLAKNGVFALATMTSAATFPSDFKSIEIQKYQIKFKTINGFEGLIKLHTNDKEVRNIREEFQNVDINYVNQNDIEHSNLNSISYSILPKKSIPKGGFNKIKSIGESLSQAKYYKNVMPIKIPLRKTDISPHNWRIEKYVLWE